MRIPSPDERFRADLLRRLDILISLMLESPMREQSVSVMDKIVHLTDLGLSPSEVARVLGKPVNYVTGALAIRKRRAKKAGQ